MEVDTMTDQERLEAILGERFERINDRFTAMDESIKVAATEMNRRLEGMNEFRAQINSAETKFMTRQEWDSAHRLLESQVRALETRLDRKEGETSGVRMTGNAMVAVVIAIAAVLGIITWFATHAGKP